MVLPPSIFMRHDTALRFDYNDSISSFKTSMDQKSRRGLLTIVSDGLVLTNDSVLTIDAGKGAAPWPVLAGFYQSGRNRIAFHIRRPSPAGTERSEVPARVKGKVYELLYPKKQP